MSVITHIEKSFSNGSRIPYALGVLDCGHSVDVRTDAQLLECHYCHGQQWVSGRDHECCGHQAFRVLASIHPHNPLGYRHHVGEIVECKRCIHATRSLDILREAIESGEIHHTRQKGTQIHAYRLDHNSPSNFMLVCSVEETPQVREYFKSLGRTGLSPLSPTERA